MMTKESLENFVRLIHAAGINLDSRYHETFYKYLSDLQRAWWINQVYLSQKNLDKNK